MLTDCHNFWQTHTTVHMTKVMINILQDSTATKTVLGRYYYTLQTIKIKRAPYLLLQ